MMNPNPSPKTFWSTVTWPRQEGVLIFGGGAVGFSLLGRLYSSGPTM